MSGGERQEVVEYITSIGATEHIPIDIPETQRRDGASKL